MAHQGETDGKCEGKRMGGGGGSGVDGPEAHATHAEVTSLPFEAEGTILGPDHLVRLGGAGCATWTALHGG